MAYLLDANIFIQAKNLHYGLDFCPVFWDWLIASNGLPPGRDYLRTQFPMMSSSMLESLRFRIKKFRSSAGNFLAA